MLTDQLKQDYKEALMNHESEKVSVLRMMISEINNKEIELRGEGKTLTDEIILQVLTKEVKKRKESAEMYSANNRQELADKENAEIVIIENYLPKQLSSEEVEAIVSKVKAETGASDFGSLMKACMTELKGKADGKVVGEAVKKILG